MEYFNCSYWDVNNTGDLLDYTYSANLTGGENISYGDLERLCNGVPSTPVVLVWWQQFLWTIVFVFLLLTAIVGNVLVIWVVIGE